MVKTKFNQTYLIRSVVVFAPRPVRPVAVVPPAAVAVLSRPSVVQALAALTVPTTHTGIAAATTCNAQKSFSQFVCKLERFLKAFTIADFMIYCLCKAAATPTYKKLAADDHQKLPKIMAKLGLPIKATLTYVPP